MRPMARSSASQTSLGERKTIEAWGLSLPPRPSGACGRASTLRGEGGEFSKIINVPLRKPVGPWYRGFPPRLRSTGMGVPINQTQEYGALKAQS